MLVVCGRVGLEVDGYVPHDIKLNEAGLLGPGEEDADDGGVWGRRAAALGRRRVADDQVGDANELPCVPNTRS